MKKNTIFIIISCLTLLILTTNCRKNSRLTETFSIQGRVLNKITGKPIPNTKIIIFPLSGCREQTGFTDNNGAYRFLLDRACQTAVNIIVEVKDFERTIQTVDFDIPRNFYFADIQLPPLAYIQVHVKDTGVLNEHLYYSFDLRHSGTTQIGGIGVDSTYSFDFLALTPDSFRYKLLAYNNNKVTATKYAVFFNIPEFQTRMLDLFY